MNAIGISIIIIIVLLGIEILYRCVKVQVEYSRKIAHLGSCAIALVAHGLIEQHVFIFICLYFAAVFIGIWKYKLLQSVENVSRKTIGSICLPLGLMVLGLTVYDQKQIFTVGVSILAFADTAVGVLRFIAKLPKKNMWGMWVHFLITFAALSFVRPIASAAIIASALTLIELQSGYGTDNFFVPVGYIALLRVF